MTAPDQFSDVPELRELASELQKDSLGFNPATIRKATITAANLTSTPPVVSIQLSGDTTTTIPNVRIQRNYVPLVGDTALILKQGNELLACPPVAATSYEKDYVRYTRTSGQSVNHNTITKVAFPNGEVTDTTFVTMSNDRDFSFVKGGVIAIVGNMPWASATAGSRWGWIGQDTDSSVRYGGSTPNPNNGAALMSNFTVLRRFAAGVAVSMYAYQDSGATQTLFPTGVGPLEINFYYHGP